MAGNFVRHLSIKSKTKPQYIHMLVLEPDIKSTYEIKDNVKKVTPDSLLYEIEMTFYYDHYS